MQPYNFVIRDFYQSNNLPLVPTRLSTAISTGWLARYHSLSLCATCTHVDVTFFIVPRDYFLKIDSYNNCSRIYLPLFLIGETLSGLNCCLSPRRHLKTSWFVNF